jgi:uncharacterized protein (DUF486 family)
LKDLADKPWYIAVTVSWLIAFFEYATKITQTATASRII